MKRTLDAAEPSPVFLSREKRQRLALERRQAAVADQRRSELPTPPPPPRDSSSSCRHHQDRHHDRRDRDRDRDGREKDRAAERAREKELEAIREQYLGGSKDKKPKTVAKPRDRFRFDWASTDDTSRVDAANNQPPHGALLLYGRGFLAGIDRREQKKAAAATLHKESGGAATYDALDMRVDTHWTAKRAEEMTERDWRILREDFGISYKGSRVPRPMRSWPESGLGAELLRNVDRAGYRKPTPIQMAAVPLGLQRRDLIGVAQTGSGKTAAFVLPMLAYIARMPPPTSHSEADEGPYALVLAPTRELAQQIERETVKLAACLGVRVVSIVGGKSDGQSTIQKQASMLERGCEVIVATPGRLLDCLESRYAVLNRCSYVVLDEADRMIDMGFEPQVVGVLDAMPSSHLKPENPDEELDEARTYRTTHMFSATMPPAVEAVAEPPPGDPGQLPGLCPGTHVGLQKEMEN